MTTRMANREISEWSKMMTEKEADKETGTDIKTDTQKPLLLSGQDTRIAVLRQIKLHPEMHNQYTWEYGPTKSNADLWHGHACQTTRCIAGWAQYLHEGAVDFYTVHKQAAIYLDLSEVDAEQLFIMASNEQAVAALEQLVDEGYIDWEDIYLNYGDSCTFLSTSEW